MFSKKPKQEPINAPKRKGADLMNQMGFGGMEDMEAMIYGDDDDDDLEAELAALAGDDAQPKKSSPKRKAPVDLSLIEKMAAQSVQDLSDEDVSDTEDPELLAELEEIDEEPPTSHGNVAALQPTFAANTHNRSPTIQGSPHPSTSRQNTDQGINVVAVLQERTSMYQQALVKARDTGDGTKQRRLERGLKTLAELSQKARTGKPVSEEDIPPPVAITTSNSITTPSASTSAAPMAPQITPPQVRKSQPSPVRKSPVPDYDDESVRRPVNGAPVIQRPTPSTSDKDTHHVLETRRDQYKNAALAAKKTGDMATATKYVRIAKQFDLVIAALDEGKPVDLSNIPPPPPTNLIGLSVQTTARPVTEVKAQRSPLQATGEKGGAAEEIDLPPEPTEEEAKRLFQAPDTPKNVMEALTQRLEKYKSSEDAAKTAGDSGKSRRMGRIVKQYEDAIKMYRAGKPVDFDELPTPPGFGPIPKDTGPPPKVSAASPSQSSALPTPSPRSQGVVVSGGASSAVSPQPKPAPKPQAPAAAAQKTAISSASGGAVKSSLSSSSVDPSGHQINRTSISRKSTSSRQEQQLGFLKERMEEFRTAALQAKKNKDLELAKQYIRMMKGMEPMVEALESGLPVDLAQVPPSPLANEDNEDKYVVVSAEDCTPTGDRDEIFTQLEEDLKTQIQTCVTNTQHFTKLGDVPAAAKFQKLEQGCRKDLDSLRSAKRHGDPVPKFHYETRSFSVVQSNTDLGETDMELNIIRGISYNLPSGYSEKDMDTMVKYEFAFPSVEEQQTGQSKTVKNTCNPEYGDVFKLQINRKSHGLARVVERKGIKLDVYIKRGFLKADKFLGTATVKLTPLETKCTFHDSFDLMEGRKSVGGKLEVKVRVRDPFKSRQVDEVKEKWLVIDQFIRTLGSKSMSAPVAQGGQKTKKQTIPAVSRSEFKDKGSGKLEGTTCMEVLRYEAQMLDKQISYLKDSLSAIQMQTLRHKRALLDEKLEMQQKQLREGGQEAWIAYIAVVEKEVISFEEEAHQLTRIGDVQKAETMMNKSKHAKKELTAIKTKFPDLVGTVARP